MLVKKIGHFAELASHTLFGHGISVYVREFAGHMSWSLAGGLTSAGILLGTNILAGRLLGAEEYGKYNVIFAISQILIVAFLFGMDLSVARSLATRSEKQYQAKDISAAFSIVLLPIILFLVLLALLYGKISFIFHLHPVFLLVAVILGIVYAVRQFLDSVMRGIRWFKAQSLARIAEAFFICCLFLWSLYFLHEKTFLAYMIPLIVGGVFLCAIYIFLLRTYFARFDREHVWELTGYGKIAFLATLLGIAFASLDKMAIARYLSFRDVGIYGAYYTASVIIVLQIGALFDNVFFPTVARFRNNLTPIIRKVDILSLYGFIPFFAIMSLIIYILLLLFGSSYPISWSYIIGFSFVATLKIILVANTSLITAYSKQSLKLGLIYGNTINILFICIFLIFLRFSHLSISSMVWFLIFYTGSFIILNKWILYRVGFYRKPHVSI